MNTSAKTLIITIVTIVTIVTTVTINCNYCKYCMVLIGQIMDDSPNSTNFPSPKHSHYTAFRPKSLEHNFIFALTTEL